jgi:xylan 1,4-beta-xylosidase
MQYNIIGIALLISFLGCNSENGNYFENNKPTLQNIYFGDPNVLVDGDTYYMYGTGRHSDTGIEVYKSTDLKQWTGPVGATP